MHVPNFEGVSGSENKGGGDNSIQFINIVRVGDKSFKEHSNSTFYFVKLCVMINFGLHHNVLCLGFVVVLYSVYGLYAVITANFLDTCTPIHILFRRTRVGVTTVSNSLILSGWVTKVLRSTPTPPFIL